MRTIITIKDDYFCELMDTRLSTLWFHNVEKMYLLPLEEIFEIYGQFTVNARFPRKSGSKPEKKPCFKIILICL